jgi:anti-sigma regulatory factor (Ser/Thr protein kinase)
MWGLVSSGNHLSDKARSRSVDLHEYVHNVAGVRSLTRVALSGLSADALEDILLVVTELVSNAFDHGESPFWMWLYLSPAPCVVRCEVNDTGPDVPVVGKSRLSDFRGRGMVLVDQLATRWGVTHRDGYKTVWAEIECEWRA